MTSLSDLRAVITESRADDWYCVEGALTYRYQLGEISGPDGRGVEIDAHHTTAVLRSDLNVTIAWGLGISSDRKYQPPYLEQVAFSRDSVDGNVDVFFAGALVDRVPLVYVDHNYLPAATSHHSPYDGGPTELLGWTVSRYAAQLSELVDALSNHNASTWREKTQAASYVVVEEHEDQNLP